MGNVMGNIMGNGMGGMSGMSANLPARVAAALEKSTTVYVGKIAASMDDSVIKTLLTACGSLKSWKRQVDPETKVAKGGLRAMVVIQDT